MEKIDFVDLKLEAVDELLKQARKARDKPLFFKLRKMKRKLTSDSSREVSNKDG